RRDEAEDGEHRREHEAGDRGRGRRSDERDDDAGSGRAALDREELRRRDPRGETGGDQASTDRVDRRLRVEAQRKRREAFDRRDEHALLEARQLRLVLALAGAVDGGPLERELPPTLWQRRHL